MKLITVHDREQLLANATRKLAQPDFDPPPPPVNLNEAKIMTFRKIIKTNPPVVSKYPLDGYMLIHRSPKDIVDLIDCKFAEQDAGFTVGPRTYKLHLLIFPGFKAILYRGLDGFMWDNPILCPNGESFRHEIVAWHKVISRGNEIDDNFLEKLESLAKSLEVLAKL